MHSHLPRYYRYRDGSTVENCTPGYTWHTQGPAGRPMVLPLPSRHSLSSVHHSPIKSDMCDRTVEHCRGNDIKFNWRSSIKLAIKTARTQRNPARLAFYEPSHLSLNCSVCSALKITNHHHGDSPTITATSPGSKGAFSK